MQCVFKWSLHQQFWTSNLEIKKNICWEDQNIYSNFLTSNILDPEHNQEFLQNSNYW